METVYVMKSQIVPLLAVCPAFGWISITHKINININIIPVLDFSLSHFRNDFKKHVPLKG